jgi:hypothetical protein
MTITTKNLDALAAKYATIKAQVKQLDSQLKVISNELLLDMHPGDAVQTPEYSVGCFAGKASKHWTESGKKHRAAFEDELIKQGFMDVKISDPFVQIRFKKEADIEYE